MLALLDLLGFQNLVGLNYKVMMQLYIENNYFLSCTQQNDIKFYEE